MKKKRNITIIAILMFIIGLSLILYPSVANYVNTRSYRRAIADFREKVEQLDDETYEQYLQAAREFNARLAARGPYMVVLTDEEQAEYEQLLDVTGTGIMGYVQIDSIDVFLPIYHGTEMEVLQSGAGHLAGSSLPVGGETTHAVVSGHTGLPSAKMFTDVKNMAEGDTFTICVLREVLTYEVDDVQVITPESAEVLQIEPGADYCTLLTCTPYGVNTHRLLVRGHRIPTPEQSQGSQAQAPAVEQEQGGWWVFVLIAAGAIAAFAVLILLVRRNGGRYSHKKRRSVHLPLFNKPTHRRAKHGR